jgi:hypothetical protein
MFWLFYTPEGGSGVHCVAAFQGRGGGGPSLLT